MTEQSLRGLKVNLRRGDTSLIHSVHKVCLGKVLAAHGLSGCSSTMSGSKAGNAEKQCPESFALPM